MNNMSTSDIKPKEDDDDDSIRVIPYDSIVNDYAKPSSIDIEDNNEASHSHDELASNTSTSTSTQESMTNPKLHHAITRSLYWSNCGWN